MGCISDEHGERFHQDMVEMEKRYLGYWDESMMGNYVWMLIIMRISYTRKISQNNFPFTDTSNY